MLGEIVLPAGTKTVKLGEIPRLIATAIYPEIQGNCPRVISYLNKLETGGENTVPTHRSEPLTENDWDMLKAIWHGLPPYREKLTELEWVSYREAFENAPHKPTWTLMPYWLDEKLNTDLARFDAENQHLKALKAAVNRGLVTPRSHALVPVSMAAGEMLMNAVLTVADFAQYADGYHIEVRTQTDNHLPEICAQQSKETQDAGRQAETDNDVDLAALFDGVGIEQLEKMFPTSTDGNGMWKGWGHRASESGLSSARVGRGRYNPYTAGLWWLTTKNPKGWDLARLRRKLAQNLPSRSMDSMGLLTGELE